MPKVIHRDAAIVAMDKPTRLLTVPGRGANKQDCLYHRVLEQFPEALVVHRLDMDTSGLILFARSPEAQRNLGLQFEKREISKTYIAIIEGVIEKDSGTIDYPMRKDMEQRLPPKHVVDCVRGKKAITKWQVLERGAATTRVALFPETGRSHQLRVHMQSIGFPIVGDPIYRVLQTDFGQDDLTTGSLKREECTSEKIIAASLPPLRSSLTSCLSSNDPVKNRPVERLMLHAQSLEFHHPVTGEPIRLECLAPF